MYRIGSTIYIWKKIDLSETYLEDRATIFGMKCLHFAIIEGHHDGTNKCSNVPWTKIVP